MRNRPMHWSSFGATGELAFKKIYPAIQEMVRHGHLNVPVIGLLRYLDGDYTDPATFRDLRRELGDSARPLHYMAIPPSLFDVVARELAEADCARNARVVVEKPFGRDLASARELNRILHEPYTWGPSEADELIRDAGGWDFPETPLRGN